MKRSSIAAAVILAAFAAPAWSTEPLLSFGGGDQTRIVSDDLLGELRGGLSVGNDFNFSFGITRTISVNGEVVAVQGLRVNDIGSLFRGGGLPSVDVIGKALTIVQLGPNNSASINSGAGGTPTPTAIAGIGGSSFSVPGLGASQGVSGAFANSFATGIQNTLNDVRIATRTQIDAQVGAFNALRSSFGSSLLRDNLVGTGAR